MLHPIRFFAERREAKNFINYVEAQKNDRGELLLGMVRSHAGDETITVTKEKIQDALSEEERRKAAQETNVPEESVDSSQKNVVSERITVPDAAMLDDSSKKSEPVSDAKTIENPVQERT